MKRAIYPGSFNPWTKGHEHVFKEACEIFDDVIIVVANNPQKKNFSEEQAQIISELYPTTTVAFHDGLIADYCRDMGIKYLIRGLRGTSDYLYEEEMAKANSEIYPELRTIYIRAKDDAISSSLVRLLQAHGKDISKYIP